MEILKIEHLSKVYGKGETAVKALDDVSFSVKKGSLLRLSVHQVLENQLFCICLAVLIDRQAERYS